jgi:hypothetical protein
VWAEALMPYKSKPPQPAANPRLEELIAVLCGRNEIAAFDRDMLDRRAGEIIAQAASRSYQPKLRGEKSAVRILKSAQWRRK